MGYPERSKSVLRGAERESRKGGNCGQASKYQGREASGDHDHAASSRQEEVSVPCLANKAHKYRFDRSPIVYIGTTKGGARRIAQSAVDKAELLLGDYGVKALAFHVVSCTPLRNVKTWRKLECALMMAFKREYGDLPVANRRGTKAGWGDSLKYFSEKRLVSVLRSFEQ